MKPESKVLSGLEKEVESLEGEKRELEVHLVRTEVWEQHLGKWRAVVQSAETSDDKEVPHFVLVVHVAEDDRNADYVSMGKFYNFLQIKLVDIKINIITYIVSY